MRQTVLIVDDHAGFRDSTRALLQASGFEVIGEAATGAEGFSQAESLRPDLVLLDIQLPDIDGIEVAERLRAQPWSPAVVLTSGRAARDFGPRLRLAPYRGFIGKSERTGPAIAALPQQDGGG